MFQKVHLRLTLLCAGITSFILILISFIYLYVSEQSLENNQFLSFQGNITAILSNLEQQTVISHELLSKLEANGKYSIFLLDNGIPFLYHKREDNAVKDELLTEVIAYYNIMYPDQAESAKTLPPFKSVHTQFPFSSSVTRMNYYASVIFMQKESGSLQAVVLYPLDKLKQQKSEQRLRFLVIDILAIFLLSLFSWFFTKKLLKPILENQKQQIQFFSSASHELRTPLAVILSCTSACASASAEEVKDFISIIQSEGLRMSALIDDLLTLGKTDSHTFTMHMEQTELDTLLLNSYEAFETMSREKNITLSVSLPDASIPACICSGSRISQVMAILLHNAISYTPDDGAIAVRLAMKEHYFLIEVSDNGIGIPDSEKELIFKPFYRIDKARSSKEHFGLGLCIASEIVRAHNGSIQITDTLGGGSTFTILLPALNNNLCP